MVWPLPRQWSETMVSIPLWAQKTLEIKGFLGPERPFLDLVSQTPRSRGRGRPLFAEPKGAWKIGAIWKFVEKCRRIVLTVFDGVFSLRDRCQKISLTLLVARLKYPPPYRETGVAIPLSHCVSCGIADYRCYTPTSFLKNGRSQSKQALPQNQGEMIRGRIFSEIIRIRAQKSELQAESRSWPKVGDTTRETPRIRTESPRKWPEWGLGASTETPA